LDRSQIFRVVFEGPFPCITDGNPTS
jgi:hypothetical protein